MNYPMKLEEIDALTFEQLTELEGKKLVCTTANGYPWAFPSKIVRVSRVQTTCPRVGIKTYSELRIVRNDGTYTTVSTDNSTYSSGRVKFEIHSL